MWGGSGRDTENLHVTRVHRIAVLLVLRVENPLMHLWRSKEYH